MYLSKDKSDKTTNIRVEYRKYSETDHTVTTLNFNYSIIFNIIVFVLKAKYQKIHDNFF